MSQLGLYPRRPAELKTFPLPAGALDSSDALQKYIDSLDESDLEQQVPKLV